MELITTYNESIHNRRSLRLQGYDYAANGLYFITICINEHQCLLGKIENDIMVLNNAGNIAEKCWLEIPQHFPDTKLHEHVIMPNHIHGIIELRKNKNVETAPNSNSGLNVRAENFLPLQSNPNHIVGVQNFEPTQNSVPRQNKFQKIIPRSIGSIVRGFKIGVTKWFRANTDIQNVWQRNYFEHIIRDESGYQKISSYIINNPANWGKDKFFVK